MADEYIKRERIEEFFNGIYDCADLIFYPNDHCCTADDCAHCKWRETMNAIQKGIREIPAADVVPVRHGRRNVYSAKDCLHTCSVCNHLPVLKTPYCPYCGAKMDGGEDDA